MTEQEKQEKLKERRGFCLYRMQFPMIQMLNTQQRADLFTMIFEYFDHGSYNVRPDQMTQLVFSGIKAQMDEDSEKWLRTCERNKRNRNAHSNDES